MEKMKRYFRAGVNGLCNMAISKTIGYRKFKEAILISTWRCNSKCIICDSWKKPAIKELTLDEYGNLFRDPLLNLQKVTITGGEPLLRSDLFEIVKNLKQSQKNLDTFSFVSNGQLASKLLTFIENVKGLKFKEFGVGISFDGIGELHDSVRGIKGVFDKSYKTYLEVKKTGVHLGVSMTITKQNYLNILDYYKFFNKDVNFVIGLHSEQYAMENSDEKLSQYAIGSNELPEVARQLRLIIQDMKKGGVCAHEYIWNKMLEYYKNPTKQIIPCMSSQKSMLIVGPEGEIYPCMVKGKILGHVRENSLSDIFSSSAAIEEMRGIAEGKCHCFAPCHFLSSAMHHPEFYFSSMKEVMRNVMNIRAGRHE